MAYDAKTALLGGIIDYAGTFPPAALSLENALRRAAAWRREGKHPWLMGKLALSLNDLKKVSPSLLYECGSDGSAWLFTALGTPVPAEASPEEFYKTIEWDLREIQRCQERWFYSSNRIEIIAYETKLPVSVSHSTDNLEVIEFVSPVLDRVGSLRGSELRDFFVEFSLEGDWELALENTTRALSEWVEDHEELGFVPGIKVRTGGAFVPGSLQLATVISKCTGLGLKFKATQGLHSVYTHGKDFGFLNVFAALALAQAYGSEKFGPLEVEACLKAGGPSVSGRENIFLFSKNAFNWKEYSLSCEEIESARKIHGATFGSCSLDEPDQDLAKEF